MAEKSERSPDEAPVTIKKYANRRLYNTATSSYVTLEHLSRMVKAGEEFVVIDARTGDDITRSVLTQIILEEESKGQTLLPIRFLRKLIGFYGDALQPIVPGFLEASMEAFARQQEELRKQMSATFGGAPPMRYFEEMARRNLAMMDRAARMFMPSEESEKARGEAAEAAPPREAEATDEGGAGHKDEIEALKAQLAQMQRQLDRISGGKPED